MALVTVNFLKILRLFFFSLQIKWLSGLKVPKCLSEDPAQTAPSVSPCIFGRQVVFEILDLLPETDICIISLFVLML